MSLIKYYRLESKSQEDVSDLEKKLQKRLLNEKYVKILLATPAPRVAEAQLGNGEVDSLERSIYDSGDFGVLYKISSIVAKEKKRIFRKDIPPTIDIKLVVSATPEDIVELQEYLSLSRFEVVEARSVTSAEFTFSTYPVHPEAINNYKAIIEEYISKKFQGVTINFKKQDNAVITNAVINGHKQNEKPSTKAGSMGIGLIYGEVCSVLNLRKIILNNGFLVPVYGSNITFVR